MHKTNQQTLGLVVIMLLLGSVLSACRSAEPELDIDAQRTGFAQTAHAQATLTFVAQPTATETPVPSPTFTPTTAVTNTPANTSTQGNGGVSPPGGGTNRAQVIIQDPPDNTNFQPGEAFAVTWTLQNMGTSTWTTSYYIQFASGEQMGAQEKVFIWLPVPPQTSLAMTVNFTAPGSPGSKVSNWKLYDASGTAFYDFSVTITVAE